VLPVRQTPAMARGRRPNFRRSEAARLAAASVDLFGVQTDGIRLPDSRRLLNLYPAVAATAIPFFANHQIKWWTSRYESAGSPTSHLLSSQIACVNHLEPARLDRRLACGVARGLGLDAVDTVGVDAGHLTYEWIGTKPYLGERRWGRRGDRCTSLDAYLPVRLSNGRIAGVAIEWKFSEIPRAGSEAVSKDGTSRVETYRVLLEDPSSPIDLDRIPRIETLFRDPYTQLLRQTLLVWQMAKHGELGIDQWLHVHVIPAGNADMRAPKARLAAGPAGLERQWQSVLKDPSRYRVVTPTQLLALLTPADGPPGWRQWLTARYGT
jgi:hypothetical protein